MSNLVRSPHKRALPRHLDELNLARLGLISMQTRVGPGTTGWEDVYGEGDERVSVRCVGTSEYLVPHGTDNDIVIGILCLFAAQGFPEDNSVTATANQFLRAAGLDTSGRYHKTLQESLMRLSHSNFHIERGWHDGKRYRTVIFRHIHEIIFDTPVSGGPLDDESRITVALPAPIAESMRRGFLKPLSSTVLSELRQPTARNLYRLLDGHRHAPNDPDRRVDRLSVGLVEWGRRARILDLRPGKIRRVLDPAHRELLRTGYLASVDYDGRGQGQTVHYVFESEVLALDPLLLSRLTGRGIAPKVARALIEALGPGAVRERLEEVEAMIHGKKTPGPGFFVSFIRSPEDYRQQKVTTVGSPPEDSQPRLLQVEPSDPNEDAQRRFQALSPTERARETLTALRMLYGARLNASEYRLLGEVLEVEALDASEVRAEAARARADGRCDEQAELLKQQLQQFVLESEG